MSTKILIAGEGGQGVQTIAKILARAAKDSGKFVTYIPGFGVEQRGGVSLAFTQFANEKIPYPKFHKADFLIIFCSRAVEDIREYISEKTIVIYDSSQVEEKYLAKIKDLIKNFLAIPALDIASQVATTKSANMVLLGALSSHIKEINYTEIEKNFLKEMAKKIEKDPAIKESNLKALQAGINYASNYNLQNDDLRGAQTQEVQREFQDDKKRWLRFPEYCKGCGLCIVRCPVAALQFSKETGFLGNPMPKVDINKCIACGKCMEICPDGAIKLEKN